MEDTNTNTNIESMPITVTTYLYVIFKNLAWLLAFAFYPVAEWIIQIVPNPEWRVLLDDVKAIVGLVIMIFVVVKLFLEIRKLFKNK